VAPRRNRGERAGITRAQVLTTALALVDRDGLAALSMRRLADELGVEAMTLYHHVANKDALLDGLVERLLDDASAIPDSDWPDALRTYAWALRAALLRHPAVLPLALSRPARTPAVLSVVERSLELLTRSGFTLGDALHLVNALTVFAVGHATAEVAVPEGAPLPSFAGFPLLERAAEEGVGTSDEERFELAVDALLAGFRPAGGRR
jgi:AcrR family transcriptional regulator